MHPVTLTFGAACAGAYLLARRSGSAAAEILSLLFAVVWAAANFLAAVDGAHLLAAIDLPAAMSSFAVWYERREPWQAWVYILFGCRMPFHVFGVWGYLDSVWYIHQINALFLATLIAVAWKGGISDAVGYCLRRAYLVVGIRLAKCARLFQATRSR